MFRVSFCDVIIFEAPQVEPAIAFSLEIHRASNVAHSICVLDADGRAILSLNLSKPVKK